MSTAFHCVTCDAVVADGLEPLADARALGEEAGQALLPKGRFALSDGQFAPECEGDVLLHLHDLVDVRLHDDPARLNGCCGPDGMDGPNLPCSNGHEIGFWRSDCWLPHHALLSCQAVRRVG